MEVTEEGEIICPVCNQTFKNKAGLQGHMRLSHHDQGAADDDANRPAEPKTTAVAKKGQSSLDSLIKELNLPNVANGQAAVFDAGVEYGMRSVVIGVRVAQELCAMGVQQAVPLIKMAQEMRESEGQAARLLATEFAEATLEANSDLKSAIGQLGQQITASGPNPMISYLMPLLMPEIQKIMGKFGGGSSQSQTVPQPQTGVVQEQPQPDEPTPLVERHKLEEWEESDV